MKKTVLIMMIVILMVAVSAEAVETCRTANGTVIFVFDESDARKCVAPHYTFLSSGPRYIYDYYPYYGPPPAPPVYGPIGRKTLPMTVGGVAAAALAGASTPGMILGGVAGWLLGDALDAREARAAWREQATLEAAAVQAAEVESQTPRETVEWYEDSSGTKWYRIRGYQHRKVHPGTVPPPAGPWVPLPPEKPAKK